jgi:hypothetical protein
MSGRKYIRIALSAGDYEKLIASREKVQNATGITMSDSLFALSLIRQAIYK